MKTILKGLLFAVMITSISPTLIAQSVQDSSWEKAHKNIIRYNLSGPLLFGFDKYILVGYERVIKPGQSMSFNIGAVGLPKFVSIVTDSFDLKKDTKNSGFNVSLDYRFYLKKENKFVAPRGIYIGPYYAFNRFNRENEWANKQANGTMDMVSTTTKFDIHTIGFQLGYQFVFWKRLALDLIMIGPGLSSYHLQTKFDGNLSTEKQELLYDAVQQLIEQKFPGMNVVFKDQEIDANGLISKWSIGYRYMINIGFNF
jgi:hypothetical protein